MKKNKSAKRKLEKSALPTAGNEVPRRSATLVESESDAAKAKLKAKGMAELIALGKEKGFLTYDDINRILPAHVTSSDEIEDVLSSLTAQHIDVQDADEPTGGEDRKSTRLNSSHSSISYPVF